MGKIALIDTEEGSISVSSLIKEGKIDLYPVSNSAEGDKAAWEIVKRKDEYDRIVFDSVTTYATTVLNNVVLEPSQEGKRPLWEIRSQLKVQQQHWGDMSSFIIRILRNLQSIKSARIILICHEGEREHPTEGYDMHAPDLNRMLLKEVYSMNDCILRLGKAPQKIKIGDTEYPRGTRVLRLEDTPQYMAKMRTNPGVTVPDLIADPTLAKFDAVCDPELRKILLYGSPGSGKTTLACS